MAYFLEQMVRGRVVLLLLAGAVNGAANGGGGGSDLSSCGTDHTAAAIELDEGGDSAGAIRAFAAAARCKKSSSAFANLGTCLMESPTPENDARALRALLLACHLSGGMNTLAQQTLAELAARLAPGDRDRQRATMAAAAAELGTDLATTIDMRRATDKYNSRDDPVLEKYFDGDGTFADEPTGAAAQAAAAQAEAAAEAEAAGAGASAGPPPKEIEVADRAAYFELLRSPAFRATYWEQYPVLIKIADKGLATVITLDEVLNGTYTVSADKPRRNVNFLGGAFVNKNTIGYAPGDTVGRKELSDGLARSQTLQLLGIHYYQPALAQLALNMSAALHLASNMNMYVTPPGESKSLAPHNDFQCSFMTQLQGAKRWQLWHKPALALPISERFIKGRDDDEQIDRKRLGAPYMDVQLRAGEVLYVPRGCVHGTDTAASADVSVHLTVGVEAMWDYGLCFTWNSFLGGDEFFENPYLMSSWQEALARRVNYSPELRKSVDLDVLAPVEPTAPARVHIADAETADAQLLGHGHVVAADGSVSDAAAPEGAAAAAAAAAAAGTSSYNPPLGWKEKVRTMLHAVVDDMVDNTQFAEKTQRLLSDTIRRYNGLMRKVVATGEGIQDVAKETEEVDDEYLFS